MLLDEIFDSRLIKIADSDNGHQIRPIPIFVELLQCFRFEILNDFRFANRNSLRIVRALEQNRKEFIRCARAGSSSQTPLFHDDATLFVNLLVVKRHVMRPVLEYQKRFVHDFWFIRRDLKHVNSLVEAGVGVQVGAESHAEGLDELHNLVFRKVCRAVEGHMFDKMGKSLLVVIFQNGSGLYNKSKLSALLGFFVRPDVIAKSIGQLVDGDFPLDRYRVGQSRCDLYRSSAQRSDEKQKEKDAALANAHALKTTRLLLDFPQSG